MTEYRQNIMNFANKHPQFGLQDMYAYLGTKSSINRQTVSWHLTKLTESGLLYRIGQGKYIKQSKQQFAIEPTDNQLIINEKLKQHWKLAHFCIYDGSIINPLLHHLAANNITYIETERDAVSVVFNYLRDNGQKAYLRPSRDLITNYIDLSQPAIFVKPLITESPMTERDGILLPTLEKILVDIQKDKDFFYLQETEGINIIRNAFSLYNINESRLLRYAGRRGIREEIEGIIKNINTND